MSGDRKDIETAVITSVEGVEYDVSVTSSNDGKSILKDRAKAAYVLTHSKEPVGLSFSLENYTLYLPGSSAQDATGDNAVFITPHVDGDAISLKSLTSQQCVAAGTAIAAIHRMRGGFLKAAQYRAYTAQDIQFQLTSWIRNLEDAGHIPSEIIENWKDIIATDGLWNFHACPVHGGLSSGDIIFMGDSISAIRHWENIQINDPARDLAWIFTHLDKSHRNNFIAAYSRVMGNHLDNMIWLRAGLWTQMEQVGEYMRALTNADTAKILAFKSQVNSLAHQIAKNNPRRKPIEKKTTLTVGDLLENPNAAQGKAETRARGGNFHKAGHTRFVVDSGIRTTSETAGLNGTSDSTAVKPVQSFELADASFADAALASAARSNVPEPPVAGSHAPSAGTSHASHESQSPRRNWNSAPTQSQSFTYESAHDGDNNLVTDADMVAADLDSISFTYDRGESLVSNEETIAMQAQSAAAAAQHAQESAVYSAYTAYTAQSSYVRVDSNGFVMDESSSDVSVTNASAASSDSYDAYDSYDSTGESEIAQDDIETTVFAAQEKIIRDDE